MSLPETNWRFKAGLDSGGGSRGAKNTRCVSEAGATELTEACRVKKRVSKEDSRTLAREGG